MINLGKRNLLGVLISAVDYDGAVEQIISAARANRRCAVTALAVHGVMTGVLDRRQGYRLNQLDLVVPDGMPVRWGINWLHGVNLPDRVYGPTLTLKVCEAAARENLPVFFYGSRSEVVQRLAENLKAKFPGLQVAGVQASMFRQTTAQEKAGIVERIRGSGARIVFVGLGCPRQEVWAYEYADELGMPLLAVGAAFDFHGGNLPQAPEAWQKRGLEWLFRLIQEPRRLWRRYLFLNPLYLTLLLLQKLGLMKVDPGQWPKPEGELQYG